MKETHSQPVSSLILWPAIITLAVTLLRLAGELLNWSPRFFSKESGGGGSLVGIAWLVVVFGAWFGWTLARSGQAPARVGRGLGLAVLAFAILPLLGVAANGIGMSQESVSTFVVYVIGSYLGLAVGLQAWPVLGRVLLAYAFAARVPVILVMLLAILGNWGTHYDAPPPGLPEMSPWGKWFFIGVIPQVSVWIWFTVVVGSIFGIAAAAIAGRARRA